MVKLKAIVPQAQLNALEQTPSLSLKSKPDDANPKQDCLEGIAVVAFDPLTGLPTFPIPTVYRNITTLANGSTALWTPTAGRRWRLLGVQVMLMQATTAAAACTLSLLDVAAATGLGVTLGIAAFTAVPNSTIVYNVDCNILAAQPSTALNVNLSSVLAIGGVSVQCWGVEE